MMGNYAKKSQNRVLIFQKIPEHGYLCHPYTWVWVQRLQPHTPIQLKFEYFPGTSTSSFYTLTAVCICTVVLITKWRWTSDVYQPVISLCSTHGIQITETIIQLDIKINNTTLQHTIFKSTSLKSHAPPLNRDADKWFWNCKASQHMRAEQ